MNDKKNQTRLNRRSYTSLARTAALAALVSLSSLASAQTAVMLDGRVLTQKVPASPFATEGPIWNLDLANQGIIVTGRKITIPATIDGTPLYISGSSALGKDGEAHTGIGAANFRQLADIRAIGDDRNLDLVSPHLGPKRLGATRSIFSTSEGRRTPFIARGRGLLRNNASQAAIEQNYFKIVQQCYQPHAAALPADFLDRAGLRNSKPEAWTYPVTAGGTLKSAGHVYLDNQGKEYLVPDFEVVIELAENVAQGVVTSIAPGNATRPDSFVMGDLLLIFNQDPRFSAEVLGFGDAVIPREEFFRQVVAGETNLAVIGHTVGEHVIFVQEVLTEFIDPTAGIHITADRFLFRVASSEARWIGTVSKPQGVRLVAVLIDTSPALVQTRREFDVPMAIDPLTATATYSARIRGSNLQNTTHVEMQARSLTTGEIEASELFDITEFRE